METRDSRWIQTYTGAAFWPLEPEGCQVRIEDIAHALSLTCRFNGHTRQFYSVAQHSVLVAELLPEPLRLYGLLHDASEAYLHDIVRPLKQAFHVDGRAYADVEDRILSVVLAEFGLTMPIPPEVFEADNRLLVTEQRDLMAPCEAEWHRIDADPLPERILPVDSVSAERLFLDVFAMWRDGHD